MQRFAAQKKSSLTAKKTCSAAAAEEGYSLQAADQ